MASEISGLKPLRGFIKQENRVVPVRFALAKKRGKQSEFVERALPELIPRVKVDAIPPVAVAPTKSPMKKLVAESQASLPLSPSTDLEAKEVYVWDESKGIRRGGGSIPDGGWNAGCLSGHGLLLCQKNAPNF